MEIIVVVAILVLVIYAFVKLADPPDRYSPPPSDSNYTPPSSGRSDLLPRSSAPRQRRKAIVYDEAKHPPPPEIPTTRQLKGRAWVIDGDTIVVNKIKVRLAGIDAPELNQPWGQKSKWKMVNLCKGQIIRVELTGDTSYDRLVGICYLPDGRDIGAEIVRAGLALDGGHFSKGKYEHLECPNMRQKLKNYGRWR